MLFLAPGTAPLTSSRLCSGSTECTVSPICVARLPPSRPAMRMPLYTREGVADEPTEPGLRMLCEPCVFGPRPKRCRLIVPAKPLPIEVPDTLTGSPDSGSNTWVMPSFLPTIHFTPPPRYREARSLLGEQEGFDS